MAIYKIINAEGTLTIKACNKSKLTGKIKINLGPTVAKTFLIGQKIKISGLLGIK